MVLDHLVSLGSLMDVPNITRDHFNTLGEWINRLLKLFLVAIRQPDMVVNICLIRDEWLVSDRILEAAHAFFVVGVGVVGQTESVVELSVVLLDC